MRLLPCKIAAHALVAEMVGDVAPVVLIPTSAPEEGIFRELELTSDVSNFLEIEDQGLLEFFDLLCIGRTSRVCHKVSLMLGKDKDGSRDKASTNCIFGKVV